MKKNLFQEKVKLIANKKIGRDYFQLALGPSRIASAASPGQFVNIKVSNGSELLLRRPFGVHRVKGKTFAVLCEILGKGTQALAQKKPGENLDIIGPLGNGFKYSSRVLGFSGSQYNRRTGKPANRQTILVAGGMGVAPLTFLAEKLAKLKTPNSKLKTLVLLGAKSKKQILCEKEFKALGFDVKIATDDGSLGFKGKVTGLLKNLLTAYSLQPTAIYACGPRPMLKEISNLSKKYRLAAQISLEEHMACGFGACLGCAVKTKNGYQRACQEGPVYNAEEIIW